MLRAYVEQVEQVEVEETLKSLFIAVISFASFVSSFVSPPQPQQCVGDAGEDAGGRHSTSTAELKAIARRCKEAGCGLHCWFGRGELCVCVICLQNNCRVWSCLRQPSDKRLIAK